MDTKIAKLKEKYSSTDYFIGASKRAKALKKLTNCNLNDLYAVKPFSNKPVSLFIWGEILYQVLLKSELKRILPTHFVQINYNGSTYYIREVGKQSQIYKQL
jgi:hypothetical protein